MTPKIGYLLPTRESIMEGRPETGPLLALAQKAEDLGYDSVWVGDSLLARPRHEPITLLAGVAGRTRRVALGTAVLLPALRNPVVLAHQVATLDQVSEGRVILGVGIAADTPPIRAEFEAAGVPFDRRVGRMQEGLRLCRALWSGQAVDWDGRWKVAGGVLGPTPHRLGGPPVWGGGSAPGSLTRAALTCDGWFPTGPNDAAIFGARLADVRKQAEDAGRNSRDVTGAVYLTLAIDDDAGRAQKRLDEFLESYYRQPASKLRQWQACYGGPAEGAGEWLSGFAAAGAEHFVLRFAGDHDNQLGAVARLRQKLGW